MTKDISNVVDKALYHEDVRKFEGLIRIPGNIGYYCITDYTVHLFVGMPKNVNGFGPQILPVPLINGSTASRLRFGKYMVVGDEKRFRLYDKPEPLP